MPTKSQIEAQHLYANLMTEIKLRTDAFNHCTTGRSGLASPFVKDFCYLQIRMMCELVALGCLVAHGEITKKPMMEEWSAGRTMSALSDLHPHFYPQPVKQTPTKGPDGEKGHHLQVFDSPLPRKAFLTLYGRCGEMLHRGSVRNLLKGQFPTQYNFPEIAAKGQRILDLLSNHILVMKSGDAMFVCMLANAEDNNNVQVAIAETPPGERINFDSPNFLRGVNESLRGQPS